MMMDWDEYRKQLIATIQQIGQASPDIVRGYRTIADGAAKIGKLDPKVRELISLAVAVTARCDGCIVTHVDAAVMPSERFVAFGYSPERDLPPGQIVPLNATDRGTPIVLFAGIHGFEPFADTLRAIGPLFEAPLSAVKLPFDPEDVPSVEMLAAPYPDRIEARFGTAPCVIAGYSIGCVIAYEVGLRMIDRGRPVRMLLLFDGFAPRRKRRTATLRARARFHLERFCRASWEGRVRMVVRHTLGGLIRGLERRLLRHLNAGIAHRLQLEDQDRSFWWEVGSLAVRYQPRSNFTGPMLLIASEEESPRFSHSEEEWRAAAVQPLEILRVPNPHIGFFEHPHMADLMQVLNPRLRK